MAQINVVRAKLHGIRVTAANLHYHGSITLDPEHCEAAGLYPLEFVNIWNKHSGARISTYIIHGEPGSRCCILNGAAARTCQIGDELIITSESSMAPEDLYDHQPKILTFTPDNGIDQALYYKVFKSDERDYDFIICTADGEEVADPVHNYAAVDLQGIRADLEAKGWAAPDIEAFVSRYLMR